MSAPRSRADARLEAWARATTRPVPAVAARRERRPFLPVLAILAGASVVLLGLAAGALVVGGRHDGRPTDPRSIAGSAAEAIASAPGVEFALSIATRYPDGSLGIESIGKIDFESRRFSGSADKGATLSMLLFGGPSSGSLIIADGLFVKTEGGPWERQPDEPTTMLDAFLDRARLSQAVASAVAGSEVDAAIRAAECGSETCQVVALTLRPAALGALASWAFGDRVSELPPDLAPAATALFVDPAGFPVRMEVQLVAGTTVTTVTLQLTRLDRAPRIDPPIP